MIDEIDHEMNVSKKLIADGEAIAAIGKILEPFSDEQGCAILASVCNQLRLYGLAQEFSRKAEYLSEIKHDR